MYSVTRSGSEYVISHARDGEIGRSYDKRSLERICAQLNGAAA